MATEPALLSHYLKALTATHNQMCDRPIPSFRQFDYALVDPDWVHEVLCHRSHIPAPAGV